MLIEKEGQQVRSVAYVAKITNIQGIPDADFIALAQVNNSWASVVKKGEFQVTSLGLKHTPLIATCEETPSISLALELASNKSKLYNTEREGVVYKCNEKQASFKAISNTYLLKQK